MPLLYKLIAIGLLCTTVLGGLGWYHVSEKKASYQAGYNQARVEHLESSQEASTKEITEKMESLRATLLLSRKDAQRANEKATELSKLIDTMKVTLDDVAEYNQVASEMECVNFGDDFFRLWNEPVKRYNQARSE